jgi:hypothetical protein
MVDDSFFSYCLCRLFLFEAGETSILLMLPESVFIMDVVVM